jgi:CheY-like chemotaxis protein
VGLNYNKSAAERAVSETTDKHILIVEDNEDSALSLQMLLEALGYSADVVHDGEQAVGAAAGRRPDIILMDIGLPGMNGYEAARRIRNEQGDASILIVALTGWGQEPDRRRSADAGIDHHLVKPLNLDQLKQILAPGPASCAG